MALQKGFPSILGKDGNDNFRGTFPSLAALQLAVPVGNSGNFAYVDAGVGSDVEQYIWDETDSEWILSAGVGGITSVNGNVGPIVVLDADDISDLGTGNKWSNAAEKAKLAFLTVTGAANLDQMQIDLANTVRVTGTQIVTGLKTFNFLNIGAATVGMINAITNFKKTTTGPTTITVQGNGATNAGKIIVENGDGSTKTVSLSASNLLAEINAGSGYTVLHINGAGVDIDTIIRGATNDNLLVIDAGQDSVGIGAAPSASAILGLSSTTKGFLPPRLTTVQRDAISSPENGLVIYNTTKDKGEQFNGVTWHELFLGKTQGEWILTVDNGTVTPLSTNTPAKFLTGGNDVGNNLRNVTKTADNRLDINEPEESSIKIQAQVSVDKSGGGTNVYQLHIYMDGSPLPVPIFQRFELGGVDPVISIGGTAQDVSSGPHFFELWVEGLTDGDDIRLETGNMSIERVW